MLLIAGIVFVCYVFVGIDGIKSNNIYLYSQLSENVDILPSVEKIKELDNVEYYRFKRSFIFKSEAHILKITYDNYKEEIQKLNEWYKFEDGLIADKSANTIPAEFSVKYEEYLYEFRMLNNSTYYMNYPNKFILLGNCDELNQIIYIYFYDSDIDSVDNMEDFLSSYCGWKH